MPGASRERMLELAERSLESRRERASIHRALYKREMSLEAVLSEPAVQKLPLVTVLAWQYHWGPIWAEWTLKHARVNPVATVEELSTTQRRKIIQTPSQSQWAGKNPKIKSKASATRARNARQKREREELEAKSGKCRGCGALLREPAEYCGFCEAER